MTAKLIFEEGFAENPLYVIKGSINEKEKGLDMINLIKMNFDISDKDWRDNFRRKLKELDDDAMTPTIVPGGLFKKTEPAFKRDPTGRITSPFDRKE